GGLERAQLAGQGLLGRDFGADLHEVVVPLVVTYQKIDLVPFWGAVVGDVELPPGQLAFDGGLQRPADAEPPARVERLDEAGVYRVGDPGVGVALPLRVGRQ